MFRVFLLTISYFLLLRKVKYCFKGCINTCIMIIVIIAKCQKHVHPNYVHTISCMCFINLYIKMSDKSYIYYMKMQYSIPYQYTLHTSFLCFVFINSCHNSVPPHSKCWGGVFFLFAYRHTMSYRSLSFITFRPCLST